MSRGTEKRSKDNMREAPGNSFLKPITWADVDTTKGDMFESWPLPNKPVGGKSKK